MLKPVLRGLQRTKRIEFEVVVDDEKKAVGFVLFPSLPASDLHRVIASTRTLAAGTKLVAGGLRHLSRR